MFLGKISIVGYSKQEPCAYYTHKIVTQEAILHYVEILWHFPDSYVLCCV